MTLTKDAIKALRDKGITEYNNTVSHAAAKTNGYSANLINSLKSGSLDATNRFKAGIMDQAKTSILAQANSTPQAVLALLS